MKKPNIVLIYIDDLGWADLGSYGSSFYETPVLDRLAASGVRFTSAYAAAPVCTPSRASLMTGKYPARVGLTQVAGLHTVGALCDVPSGQRLPINEVSLARALAANGYDTWHIGKWHLGSGDTAPERHGFKVNIAGGQWGMPPQGYSSPYGIDTLVDGPPGEYLTDRLTDESIKLIEGRGSDPFFLYLAHYAVHVPIQAPEELVAKYRSKATEQGLDRLSAIEIGELQSAWHLRELPIRRRRFQSDPEYAAMVENLDQNVGRLIDSLEQLGIRDDTLIIFTSDNGGLGTAEGSPTCNAPLSEGKGWLSEGGVRVPLIISWPAVIAAGAVIDDPVTTPDLYPTVLDAAGLPSLSHQHVDGFSAMPALRGEHSERGPIFWHFPHYSNQGGRPVSAVREGTWKLIEYLEDGRVELFDLSTDISESENLADAMAFRKTRDRLHALLSSWKVDVGALHPRPNLEACFPDIAGDAEYRS